MHKRLGSARAGIISLVFAIYWVPSLRGSPPTKDLKTLKKEALNFFNEYSWIRLVINDSPGLGHQSANALLYKKIRSLGYQGLIEVYYNPIWGGGRLHSKLSLLFPELPGGVLPVFPCIRNYNEFNLRFVNSLCAPRGDVAFAPLAITAALDESTSIASRVNARHFLKLQPQAWDAPERFIISSDMEEMTYKTSLMTELASLGIPNSVLTYSGEMIFKLPKDLNALPHIDVGFLFQDTAVESQKQPPLLNALDQLRAKEAHIELLPVYGNDKVFNSDHVLNLLYALDQATELSPENFQKPIIIPILNADFSWPDSSTRIETQFSSTNRTPVRNYFFVQGSRNSKEIAGILESYIHNSKSVIILNYGPVKPEEFNALMSASSLPPVVSGVNSRDLLTQLGKPYLSDYRSPLFLENPSVDGTLKQNIKAALSGVAPSVGQFRTKHLRL